MSVSLPDSQIPLPVTLNVPVSVKPGAVSSTTLKGPVSLHLGQWKIFAAVALLGIAVGGTLVYLILTKKIKLPWLGAVAIEAEEEKPTRKISPPSAEAAVKEIAPAAAPAPPAAPAAPFGSGKRWTPIEALRR
jgi:hypothetical protein